MVIAPGEVRNETRLRAWMQIVPHTAWRRSVVVTSIIESISAASIRIPQFNGRGHHWVTSGRLTPNRSGSTVAGSG
jgi:hypothetical protein